MITQQLSHKYIKIPAVIFITSKACFKCFGWSFRTEDYFILVLIFRRKTEGWQMAGFEPRTIETTVQSLYHTTSHGMNNGIVSMPKIKDERSISHDYADPGATCIFSLILCRQRGMNDDLQNKNNKK